MKHAHQSPYKLLDTKKCDINIIGFGISAFDISIQIVKVFSASIVVFSQPFPALYIFLLYRFFFYLQSFIRYDMLLFWFY